MGVIGRLEVGVAMARRSVRVLRSHPRLLAFPLLGGLSAAAFMATLLGGLYVMGPSLQEPGPALYATLFVAYLLETFVASFFTAALVAATRTVFDGDEPSIRGALATAWQRKLSLLAWSLVAAVIGVVIRVIEGQNDVVTRIVAGVFAVAWSVMTFFIIPVIVFRDPSVTETFKRSARTFKDTWGESIGALGAIDVVTVLLVLAGIGPGGLTFLVTAGLGTVRPLAALLIGGTAVSVGLLVGKALSGIARTALYRYATRNDAPERFDDVDFTGI
jgi:hypothetical protein